MGALNGGIEFFVDVSQPGAHDHNSFVAHVHHGVEDVGFHGRVVIKHRHLVTEIGFDDNVAVATARVIIFLYVRESVAGNHGQRCVTDSAEGGAIRRVHLAHARAFVQQAIFVAGGAKHAHHHLGNVAMSGGIGGVHQVEGGVGAGSVAGTLRTNQDDGHGRILHHKRERRSGVVQCVGAMPNDDAVDAIFDFFANGFGQRNILLRTHVFAEYRKDFFGGEVADVGELGYGAI